MAKLFKVFKRKTRRWEKILWSALALLLVAGIAVGVALWAASGKESFTNHLQAGELKLTLSRTNLKANALDDEGYITPYEDNNALDLTKAGKQNVFGLESGDAIAPGCWWEAELTLSGGGALDYAYWIEIKCDKALSGTLAEQVFLTVDTATTDMQKTAISALPDKTENGKSSVYIGSESAPLESVTKSETCVFTVRLEFPDQENNNEADGDVRFDLIVHAVQIQGEN